MKSAMELKALAGVSSFPSQAYTLKATTDTRTGTTLSRNMLICKKEADREDKHYTAGGGETHADDHGLVSCGPFLNGRHVKNKKAG